MLLKPLLVAGVGILALIGSPDQSGTSSVMSDDDQDPFAAIKTVEVFLAGNPTTPAGPDCAADENTYLYRLTHDEGDGSLIELTVEASAGVVSSAGFIPAIGFVAPSSITSNPSDVTFQFLPGGLDPGESSTVLFICSPRPPQNAVFTVESSSGATASDDSCLGPADPACGDGILDEPAEQCDDGNTASGDGCSATCTLEEPERRSCAKHE